MLVTVSAVFVFIAMLIFTYTYLTVGQRGHTNNSTRVRVRVGVDGTYIDSHEYNSESQESGKVVNYGSGDGSGNASQEYSNIEMKDRTDGRETDALFGRKDQPGQHAGSVLGQNDRHPAVVQSTNTNTNANTNVMQMR